MEFMLKEPEIAVLADEKTLMQVFELTPIQARFIQAMLNARGWVGKDELPEVKYSTRQLIYKLRQKMKRHRVMVLNDNNGRYSIPPESKIAIKLQLEKTFHDYDNQS